MRPSHNDFGVTVRARRLQRRKIRWPRGMDSRHKSERRRFARRARAAIRQELRP
jgi:hypothetical protein